MRVLITGAEGQLGTSVAKYFTTRHVVLPFGHRDLDIADTQAVTSRVEAEAPDVVINCAAFNDVDAAEAAPLEALSVNAIAVLSLARAAARSGAVLVHFSSDYVFDGCASTPYTEDSRPAPRSAYGISKLAGEWAARDGCRSYVLRVASLFGGKRSGWSPFEGIVQALRSGQEVRPLSDRTVSATYVEDVAKAIDCLLQRQAPTGVYHCVNSGMATWCELTYEVARQLEVEARVVPTTVASLDKPAPRPRFTPLSNRKLASVGIEMPPWQDALSRYLSMHRVEVA